MYRQTDSKVKRLNMQWKGGTVYMVSSGQLQTSNLSSITYQQTNVTRWADGRRYWQ